MGSGDRIARAIVADGAARVVAVVATDLVREAARRHDAGPTAAIAMGRAATAGLLLATLTKDEERVSVQIIGKGALGTITVDASSAGTARVFVAHPRAGAPLAPARRPVIGAAVGDHGLVNVIRDMGAGHDFNGQTSLVDGEIDTDVESYLCQSEQIDSALACETVLDAAGHVAFAVGVLVQALPNGEGTPYVADARTRLREGAFLGALVGDDLTPADVIAAALGTDVDVVTPLGDREVRFYCPCSRDRAASTLALLGAEDLLTLIREEGTADVTCEFCRERYDFTDAALEDIRQRVRGAAGPPS
jgi:molecular chaperone Hsp33